MPDLCSALNSLDDGGCLRGEQVAQSGFRHKALKLLKPAFLDQAPDLGCAHRSPFAFQAGQDHKAAAFSRLFLTP